MKRRRTKKQYGVRVTVEEHYGPEPNIQEIAGEMVFVHLPDGTVYRLSLRGGSGFLEILRTDSETLQGFLVQPIDGQSIELIPVDVHRTEKGKWYIDEG